MKTITVVVPPPVPDAAEDRFVELELENRDKQGIGCYCHRCYAMARWDWAALHQRYVLPDEIDEDP